ncbi:hypothetical protein B0H11DRAFT_1911576 [Mycena galericulata]|nr:hypothetical protein B0H11DRAFT_1911576 [Mycena galericulata]
MESLNLGGCTSKICAMGCGIFVPDTSGPPAANPALVKCAICSCVAGQHIIRAVQYLSEEENEGSSTSQYDNPPSSSVPAPQSRPAPSATHNTMFGSRDHVPKATAAAGGTKEKLSGPFREAAQKREDFIEATLRHPLDRTASQKPFNPAAKAQAEGDLNPHNSTSKQRKRKATDGPGAHSGTGKAAVKKIVGTKYTMVLVEGTKDVALDRYRRPGPDKCGI